MYANMFHVLCYTRQAERKWKDFLTDSREITQRQLEDPSLQK